MDMMQIIWLCAVALFVVLEAVTFSSVSIWFCAGALAALVVSLIWPQAVAAQLPAFVLVSLAALFALRPLAKRLLPAKRARTNADANIGKVGQVISEIQPNRVGRVKLEGLDWSATSGQVLPVGAWCRVEAIEGVKLVVSPAEA